MQGPDISKFEVALIIVLSCVGAAALIAVCVAGGWWLAEHLRFRLVP